VVELSTVTSCDCGPPSDHALNSQDFLAFVCGEVAEIECCDPWINGPWVQPDGLRIRQTARVSRRESQLEVRGVLVVRRGERAAHTSEGLQGVGVTVGRAVVEDQVPRQRGPR
jgi:hypothetical protein